VKRKHFIAKKPAAGKRPLGAKPADELPQQNLPNAIASLHRTLGNHGVARLLGGKNIGSPLNSLTIQRQPDDELARMKEAFKRGGITEEMIRGERTDGFINYNEETGIARWEPITLVRPVPKPGTGDEMARMKEAFKRGGITEEMIRGERTDGVINYDEETGVARWEPITLVGPEPKPSPEDEIARMKEAFRKGGITEEMIRGERTDGVIIYNEETGTASWETITFVAPPASKPAATKKPRTKKRMPRLLETRHSASPAAATRPPRRRTKAGQTSPEGHGSRTAHPEALLG
jgi:hypothetical protein